MAGGKLIQYKIYTEPVYFDSAPPAEDITLDKWYQPTSEPVRLIEGRDYQPNSLVFLPPLAGYITPTYTLEDIFCQNFETQTDFTDWVALFDSIIANETLVDAATFNYLDSYLDDRRVDKADRDYWLDRLLKRHIPVASRLSWTGDDPLGLQTGTANVIIIDSSSSNAKYVKRSSNSVYTDPDYDPSHAASPALLWDNNASGSEYNHKIWGDIVSLDEIGSSTRRRFPPDGREVIVYVRGGSYTLAQEITIAIQPTNVPAPRPNWRIIWRNYPGEYPIISSGNSFNGTDYLVSPMYSISRPDFIFGDGIEFVGFRDDGATRIFGWAQFIIYGARSKLIGSNIHNTHGLDPLDANAGSFPDYVDDAYNDRSAAIVKHAIQWQADNGLVRDNYIKLADSDFPSSGFASDGEGIDNNSDYTTFKGNTFDGIAFHTQLRSRGGIGTIIEYNDFSNYADTTCLNVYSSSFVTVRYNRIYNYCQTTGPTNDGNGMQIQDTNDSEFYENVIYNFGVENPGWGLRIGCEPGVGTAHRNVVRNNIVYGAGIALRYYGGWNAGAYMNDNEIYNNVIIDLPANNKLTAAYNAPVLVLIGSSTGNLIYDNLIGRLDASLIMLSVQTGVATHVTYDIDDAYTGYTGNYTSDPLFRDPVNGDFSLLEGSPVSSLFTSETPLTEFEEDLEIYSCPISMADWVQPINDPTLPLTPPYIDSSVDVVNSLPYLYRPVAELLVDYQVVPVLPPVPPFIDSSVDVVNSLPYLYQPVAELLTDYAVIPVRPKQPIAFLEPAYWYGILTDIPVPPEPVEPEIVITQYPTIYSALFNTFDIDI